MTKDHLATLQRVLTEWGSGCAEGGAAAWAITEIEALKQERHQLKNDLTAARLERSEVERLQMSLKRYEPVSLYNGHDIDWWQTEAERLRGALDYIAGLGPDCDAEARAHAIDTLEGAAHEPNATRGTILSGEDSVRQTAESSRSPELPCVWASGCQDVPRCTEAGKCLQISRKGSAVNTESGAPGREAGDRAGPRVSRHTEKSRAAHDWKRDDEGDFR